MLVSQNQIRTKKKTSEKKTTHTRYINKTSYTLTQIKKKNYLIQSINPPERGRVIVCRLEPSLRYDLLWLLSSALYLDFTSMHFIAFLPRRYRLILIFYYKESILSLPNHSFWYSFWYSFCSHLDYFTLSLWNSLFCTTNKSTLQIHQVLHKLLNFVS